MIKESPTPLFGNDQYEGFAIDLIKELAAMRGFNYTFRIREDKANGEKLPNGSWTGMIGDIREEVGFRLFSFHLLKSEIISILLFYFTDCGSRNYRSHHNKRKRGSC